MIDGRPLTHAHHRRHRVAAAILAIIIFPGSLATTGCDRMQKKAPTVPLPHPQTGKQEPPHSLHGNAVLSNALLSFRVHCNAQAASVRICEIPRDHLQRQDASAT